MQKAEEEYFPDLPWFGEGQNKKKLKQESTPVGCVPPACQPCVL